MESHYVAGECCIERGPGGRGGIIPWKIIYNHATSIGPQWERAGSAELFQPDGGTEFAVNCGVEIQGNASRDNARTPKHSFRLVFKNEYGPTRLSYAWFPGPVQELNTIGLRAFGFVDAWSTRYSDTSVVPGTSLIGLRYRPENATYLKDAWLKQSLRDMGQPATRSDFVHLYVNGLYWGFYNPSERIDAVFCASHFGGREEAWDVLAGDEAYDAHANAEGHARIAAALAHAAGVPAFEAAWADDLPPAPPPTAGSRIVAEIRWVTRYLIPWLWRHAHGRSSGDGGGPKRPVLKPVEPAAANAAS